jgi:phosphoenolpyruvate carboxylase
VLTYLKSQFPAAVSNQNNLIRMGFWPGGDRDGNPFVRAETTLRVADALRGSILKSYYLEVRKLKKRLTFVGVEKPLNELEQKLYNNLFVPGYSLDLSKEEILTTLYQIRKTLVEEHLGLFLNLLESLITKVECFGLFFTSLDIRQDSSVHSQLLEVVAGLSTALPDQYSSLSDEQKIGALQQVAETVDPASIQDDLLRDTLDTIAAVRTIQQFNGEEGCHRYIISHSTSALNVLEVYALFRFSGWQPEELSVDIVPLFETIEDLRNAGDVMMDLYRNKLYREHLRRRKDTQTIMLGFSDGTKDGGYFMANWSIYKAKEELTYISKKFGVEVIFFDGRGGPPARGGGKTHQFYASMGSNIANKQIQLTIQGQTISSNFGTVESAQFNIEQLMHAGINNALFSSHQPTLTNREDELLQLLANESFEAYSALKNHPEFLEYLTYISPLRYYGEANIGSRPSKRKAGKLNLNDLRAVPYVGSWSQLKQNLPGYYGVGYALEALEKAGRWEEFSQLYEQSLFLKALLDNCEMAMKKCFFPATAYLSDHPKYGELWRLIYDEYERTKKYVLRLSGASELMEDKPVEKLSVQMRERIELPLITIQQHSLTKIRELEEKGVEGPEKKIYEKLVMRCSFGIINAERNSA